MPEETRQHLTAGVDTGSSSVKVAVVRSRAGGEVEILAKSLERIRRRHVREVARKTFDDTCVQAGVQPEDLDYVTATGDGDAVDFHTGHFYSMTTHARGALVLEPGWRNPDVA